MLRCLKAENKRLCPILRKGILMIPIDIVTFTWQVISDDDIDKKRNSIYKKPALEKTKQTIRNILKDSSKSELHKQCHETLRRITELDMKYHMVFRSAISIQKNYTRQIQNHTTWHMHQFLQTIEQSTIHFTYRQKIMAQFNGKCI